MARPSSLTKTVMEQLIASVERGNTKTCAAGQVGIAPGTLWAWLQKGRRDQTGESLYAQLYEGLTRASSKAEAVMADALFQAGTEDYKAAVEWLKRRRSQDWSAVQVVRAEVEAGLENMLESVRQHMSHAAYAELIRAIAVVQGLADGEDEGDGADARH